MKIKYKTPIQNDKNLLILHDNNKPKVFALVVGSAFLREKIQAAECCLDIYMFKKW